MIELELEASEVEGVQASIASQLQQLSSAKEHSHSPSGNAGRRREETDLLCCTRIEFGELNATLFAQRILLEKWAKGR